MGLIEWEEERDGLYGVVEWINGNPILDGMPYFKGKDAAIKYATERESMGNMSILEITDLKYTIIRLTKADSAGLVQRPESCGKWLPIKTAPKDGAEILATRWNDVFKKWDTAVVRWTGNTWPVVPTRDGRLSLMGDFWMPLPETPE